VVLWKADGANSKEATARARYSSVSSTPDRCEHLLPGSEQRLNYALDALAEGAHVARTPDDRDGSLSDTQPSDQDEI
jgi:hypothetical protein